MLIVSLSGVEDCYKYTSTSLSVTLIFRFKYQNSKYLIM